MKSEPAGPDSSRGRDMPSKAVSTTAAASSSSHNTGPSDRLNRWLTLGANLGVLLGLIILIVEVRQNALLTRLSIEVSKNALMADIELSLAQPEHAEIWVKSYLSPETMNDVERRVVESYLVALLMQWDYMLQMNRSGLITRSEAEQNIRNSAPFYFGSRFGKLWFSEEMGGWEGPDRMDIALPILETLDEDFLRKRAERLRVAPESKAPSA